MAFARRVRLLALVLLSGAALLLLGAGLAIAADQAVNIQGFAFHPATVTVNVGDMVTWTNSDGIAHTATANNGSFDTDAIGSGSSKSVTFNDAGSFGYHCEIHPTMHGTVVVRAASTGGGGTTQPDTATLPANASGTDAGSAPIGALLAAMSVGALAAATLLVRRRPSHARERLVRRER